MVSMEMNYANNNSDDDDDEAIHESHTMTINGESVNYNVNHN